MYNWLVFLHILFAFLFMLAHGVHAAAMLEFRGEPDPERSLTFFNIVPTPMLIRVLTVLLGFPAFAAVALAGWWQKGWVWASVVVFVIISFVMFQYGAGYYNIIEGAARRAVEARKTNVNVPAAMEVFDKARNAPNAMVVSVVGIVGLAIILWLMRFKPF
jgi:small-conductance mechanosensitive channel